MPFRREEEAIYLGVWGDVPRNELKKMVLKITETQGIEGLQAAGRLLVLGMLRCVWCNFTGYFFCPQPCNLCHRHTFYALKRETLREKNLGELCRQVHWMGVSMNLVFLMESNEVIKGFLSKSWDDLCPESKFAPFCYCWKGTQQALKLRTGWFCRWGERWKETKGQNGAMGFSSSLIDSRDF